MKQIFENNCKNKIDSKKGITLISLAIIIMVIIIISSVTIYTGVDTIANSRVTQFNTELKIIHARVNEIASENLTQEEIDTLGQTISTLNSNIKGKISKALQGSSEEGFRYFNKKNLEAIGVSGINREVIINFSKRDVVDINGVKKDGNYIYRVEGWDNIEYVDKNTKGPSFEIRKKIYGLSATIRIENIVYNGNINKGMISYCLYNDNVEKNWKTVQENEILIDRSGIYKIRVTDAAGNVTEKTTEIVLTNKPKLDSGMVPVVYDKEKGKWKITEENGGTWYDYSSEKKQWANAMLQDGLTINDDGTIDSDKMGSMFVWIPRYAYQISSGYHPTSSTALPLEGNINIKFLKGTTGLSTDNEDVKYATTSGEGNWLIHPAFTSNIDLGGNGKEITGFWVAKFEASSSTTTAENPNLGANYGRTNNETDNVRSVPNVTSWRKITADQIDKACKRMTQKGNIHGLSGAQAYMMKNSEWGAIAYLTQSDYGNKQTNADVNSGVWTNPYHEGDIVANENATYKHNTYYTTMTGMVGSSRDESIIVASKAIGNVDKSNPETISITYQNYATDGSLNGSQYTKTYYRYQTEEGQRGSSTRNIYGIYDISGGAWEYVASYLTNGKTSQITYFRNLVASQKQEYAGTGVADNETDRKANYQANSNKYGDATWETSRDDAGKTWGLSWNNDFANFPYLNVPFFLRGGTLDNGSGGGGVFAFTCASGNVYDNSGFRPILIMY